MNSLSVKLYRKLGLQLEILYSNTYFLQRLDHLCEAMNLVDGSISGFRLVPNCWKEFGDNQLLRVGNGDDLVLLTLLF